MTTVSNFRLFQGRQLFLLDIDAAVANITGLLVFRPLYIRVRSFVTPPFSKE